MEVCGLFRVVTSQSTLPIATLAFDFRSGEGRGIFQLGQVYAFKIWTNVLQEESS